MLKRRESSTLSHGTTKKAAQIFIWNANLAYAIGLLVTDGNLSKDGRHITLSSSDIEQLNNFSFCLGITNKISQVYNNGYAIKPAYRIQFGNVQLYRWLLTIGLFPAKTHTIGAIQIPDIFFRDFLRGHLDGDGSIIIYKDQYNIYKGKIYTYLRIYIKFISASYEHIIWLQAMIHRLLGLKGAISCNDYRKKTPMWELKFAKKDSLKLIKWLYYKSNLPCLKRKRLLAQDYLRDIGP